MKQIIYLVLCLFILFTIITGGLQLMGNLEDKIEGVENQCRKICNSNDLEYIKYTKIGFAGSITNCYCKKSSGGITTIQL